jgi:hypothetical protein
MHLIQSVPLLFHFQLHLHPEPIELRGYVRHLREIVCPRLIALLGKVWRNVASASLLVLGQRAQLLFDSVHLVLVRGLGCGFQVLGLRVEGLGFGV